MTTGADHETLNIYKCTKCFIDTGNYLFLFCVTSEIELIKYSTLCGKLLFSITLFNYFRLFGFKLFKKIN